MDEIFIFSSRLSDLKNTASIELWKIFYKNYYLLLHLYPMSDKCGYRTWTRI